MGYRVLTTQVWNYNVPNQTSKGFQSVAVDYSEDGVSWQNLAKFYLATGQWVKEVMVALQVLILWDFQPGTFFFPAWIRASIAKAWARWHLRLCTVLIKVQLVMITTGY
ncbi:MAG: hypothetical protein IPH94_19160 [Saprospiraceae bacterium]|nr:hypothetical protein [Saprospiraceae bacterium]